MEEVHEDKIIVAPQEKESVPTDPPKDDNNLTLDEHNSEFN